MGLPLAEIARLIDGTLSGQGDLEINGAATLPVARPGEITLADNSRLAEKLARCEASAVIVPASLQPTDRPYITVGDVHAAFGKVVAHFHPPRQTHFSGVSKAAYVSPTARIAEDVEVHPQAFIGEDVEIGEGTIIHSGARVLDGCKIGVNCLLFPNVVLYENTVVGQNVICMRA